MVPTSDKIDAFEHAANNQPARNVQISWKARIFFFIAHINDVLCNAANNPIKSDHPPRIMIMSYNVDYVPFILVVVGQEGK